MVCRNGVIDLKVVDIVNKSDNYKVKKKKKIFGFRLRKE